MSWRWAASAPRSFRPEQLLTLSTGVTRMAAETLPKYPSLPRDRHGSAAFLGAAARWRQGEDPETALTPPCKATGQILYNYFSSPDLLGGGPPGTGIIADLPKPAGRPGRAAAAAASESPLAFYHEKPNTPLDHRAQVVAQVQQYIRGTSDRTADAQRCSCGVQLQPELPEPAFCTKQRDAALWSMSPPPASPPPRS